MRPDPYQARARELCVADGKDPDSRVGEGRGRPAWCDYRDAVRAEQNKQESDALASAIATFRPQLPQYQDRPLMVMGRDHEQSTRDQMTNCMKVGNVIGGALCADGHLGYAQAVGGVIAYEDQVSVSGVGFDIACGNMAVRLALPYVDIKDQVPDLTREIANTISFGVGRTNDERVEHPLFDDAEAWYKSDREDFKSKAQAQLGTVGGGNHYVDLFEDEVGLVWIGVHFGSRGLGHTSATKYIKAAGGKDGIHVAPTVLDIDSELGQRYLEAMHLAGRYAYAGREWVVGRVRKILGDPTVVDTVHNHHNFAWLEEHNGRALWVVRKGATPAFPGQRGFVGGSMGDNAVIIEGVEGNYSKAMYYSTIHGAGRLFGRKEAKRRFTHTEMDAWLRDKGVFLVGGDLDESPMAYRRLPDVLSEHVGTIRTLHTLRPFSVVMAGEGEHDPYKE